MQINIKKRLSISTASEITLPYYYRIFSKGNYLFGCVTADHHYIISMVSASGNARYETEAKAIENNIVDIEYSSLYQTFSASTEVEFAKAMSEVSHALKTLSDAINIKR